MSKTKSTSINSELEAKLARFAETQAELKKTEKALVDDVVSVLKEIITTSDYISAARWQQYTPGFNDGDPCEFSVRELQVKFSDSLMAEFNNEENEEEEFVDEYQMKRFLEKHMDVLNHEQLGILEGQLEALNKLHGTLSNMESALETRFGNNIQITLTKKGIETEDYDCGY